MEKINTFLSVISAFPTQKTLHRWHIVMRNKNIKKRERKKENGLIPCSFFSAYLCSAAIKSAFWWKERFLLYFLMRRYKLKSHFLFLILPWAKSYFDKWWPLSSLFLYFLYLLIVFFLYLIKIIGANILLSIFIFNLRHFINRCYVCSLVDLNT